MVTNAFQIPTGLIQGNVFFRVLESIQCIVDLGHVMRLELGLGRQTWQHAREYCQSKGGNLARIKDHMMQDFLIGDVTSDHHTSTGKQMWCHQWI